jgi:hypothetical protein
MKKIDQKIIDRAVESHYKKLKFANVFTQVAGVVGIATFTTLTIITEHPAYGTNPVVHAYAVGVLFSALVFGFGLAAAAPAAPFKKIRPSDNINKF